MLEWRLLGTFRELISWQRRTDNQLDADQFLDEQPAPSAPVVLDPNVPPAPPAPNMTTLSHKTALFNWMRWLDVGQTVSTRFSSLIAHYMLQIHAPITQAQIARVQEQDLLAATEAVKQEQDQDKEVSAEHAEEPSNTNASSSAALNTAPDASSPPSSTRKRKLDAVESEEDETSSPANKKQRNN